tara:strand:+ start:665 stop:1411 length:747 start_codon:yes stop_codon:yes gene_type:complete
MKDKPIVLAVATEVTNDVNNFTTTLDQHGYDYRLLGVGMEWPGFILKFELYKASLNNIDPEQVVILSDSSDVLFVRSWVDDYLPVEGRISVGAEVGGTMSSPLTNFRRHWYMHPEPKVDSYYNAFVNSGFVVGRCKDLKVHYSETEKEIKESKEEDDQKLLCAVMNKFPERYCLDTLGKWSVTMAHPTRQNVKLKPEEVVYTHVAGVSKPLALHYAGKGHPRLKRTRRQYKRAVKELMPQGKKNSCIY